MAMTRVVKMHHVLPSKMALNVNVKVASKLTVTMSALILTSVKRELINVMQTRLVTIKLVLTLVHVQPQQQS